jgi:hypothetical protein
MCGNNHTKKYNNLFGKTTYKHQKEIHHISI